MTTCVYIDFNVICTECMPNKRSYTVAWTQQRYEQILKW